MTTTTAANVTPIEDTDALRWLAARLAPARARLERAPEADAVERIRARLREGMAAPRQERRAA
jgi:hypothetical protein